MIEKFKLKTKLNCTNLDSYFKYLPRLAKRSPKSLTLLRHPSGYELWINILFVGANEIEYWYLSIMDGWSEPQNVIYYYLLGGSKKFSHFYRFCLPHCAVDVLRQTSSVLATTSFPSSLWPIHHTRVAHCFSNRLKFNLISRLLLAWLCRNDSVESFILVQRCLHIPTHCTSIAHYTTYTANQTRLLVVGSSTEF